MRIHLVSLGTTLQYTHSTVRRKELVFNSLPNIIYKMLIERNPSEKYLEKNPFRCENK